MPHIFFQEVRQSASFSLPKSLILILQNKTTIFNEISHFLQKFSFAGNPRVQSLLRGHWSALLSEQNCSLNSEAEIYCNTISCTKILHYKEWLVCILYTNESVTEILFFHHFSNRQCIDIYYARGGGGRFSRSKKIWN